MRFPKDFVWGAAAAAYQIEGAAREDGKGLSVWDVFCQKPGAVWSGQSGDVACDHYHRYRKDVALMREIGLKAYRLSISWPRVLPNGTGRLNEKGMAFYDRLIDALLDANIQPYVTLFHWDYPQALYCRGGWLNRESADWFADYATAVTARLGDRVKHWMTLNEPQCFVGLGHHTGGHAPGDKLDWPLVLRMAHHSLLAHGKGVQAIRAASKGPCQIGFAPVGLAKYPASEKPADVEAARKAMFSVTGADVWNNSWWMDPVFLGRYPEDGLKLYGAAVPAIEPADMKVIRQKLDFFGVNIYHGAAFRRGSDGQPEHVPVAVGHPLTAFYWNVTPEALYWGPRFFYERYKLPIYVTENGMANTDWVALDGKVHDPQRIDFTTRYLKGLGKAIRDGVDVRGYFHWSIMDNFEWAEGYKQRFGMVYVDYPTQKRIPKDSARWYRSVIKTNGANIA